jgi:hypothetical protein
VVLGMDEKDVARCDRMSMICIMNDMEGRALVAGDGGRKEAGGGWRR